VSSHAARGHVLAARAAASGRTVLAEPIAAEVVEVDGGRVWVADPLDAFPRGDQRIYLDWSEGKPGGRAALAHASLVLVRDGSAAGRASAGDGALRRVARGDGYTLYRVAPKARR
jgi:hypothetical protein